MPNYNDKKKKNYGFFFLIINDIIDIMCILGLMKNINKITHPMYYLLKIEGPNNNLTLC